MDQNNSRRMLYNKISKSILTGSIMATALFGVFALGAYAVAVPSQNSERTLAIMTDELQTQNPQLAASVFAAVSTRSTAATSRDTKPAVQTSASVRATTTTSTVVPPQPVAPVNPVPVRIKQWYTTAPGLSGCHLWQLNTETNVLTDLGVGTVLNLNGQNYCYVGMIAGGLGSTSGGTTVVAKPFVSDVTLNTSDRYTVSVLQTALASGKFYTGEVTGKWDSSLGLAVKAYQKANKLRQSGIVDSGTRAILNTQVYPVKAIGAF